MRSSASFKQRTVGSLLAASLLGAAGLAAADTIFLPITRDGPWPVKCAQETLGTCHNRWHPDINPRRQRTPATR
jgi:hypothetical protein